MSLLKKVWHYLRPRLDWPKIAIKKASKETFSTVCLFFTSHLVLKYSLPKVEPAHMFSKPFFLILVVQSLIHFNSFPASTGSFPALPFRSRTLLLREHFPCGIKSYKTCQNIVTERGSVSGLIFNPPDQALPGTVPQTWLAAEQVCQ